MARGESEGDKGGEVEGWGGRMLWRVGAKAAKAAAKSEGSDGSE